MPVAALPAIAAGISAVGGVASLAKGLGGGGGAGGQDISQYDQVLRQQMLQLYSQVPLPDLSGAPNTAPYQGETWLSDFTPETYNPYIGEMTQMSDDPAMRDKQMQTLSQLGDFAKGGLLPSDQQALATIQQSQAGAAGSQSQAVVDQLRQRGLGGAGAEMAARLSGNQQAAEGSYNLYNQALADALSRQTSAITQQGQLATNVRGQEADISQQMADISNNFNTQVQNLRTSAAANAAQTRNTAAMFNLQGKQNVANNNVTTANANNDLYRQVSQQGFQNQLTKLGGMQGATNAQLNDLTAQQAANNKNRAAQEQDMTTGLNTLADLAKQASKTNWFGLGGSSGGGSLASWASSHANDPSYQGVV